MGIASCDEGVRRRPVALLRQHPEAAGCPQAHSPGTDADRILIYGSGAAVGWGVSSHDLALPCALAKALSARSGRGVDVDIASSPSTSMDTAFRGVAGLRLSRFDAIVLTFGARAAVDLSSVQAWRRQLTALLCLFERESSRTTHMFVLGNLPIRSIPAFGSPLGSVAARHSVALDRATAEVCASMPRTTFIAMPAASQATAGRYRTASDYRNWAELMADSMAAPLDAEHLAVNVVEEEPDLGDARVLEEARQRAVDGLGILDTAPRSGSPGSSRWRSDRSAPAGPPSL